jgi:hypothetical protein
MVVFYAQQGDFEKSEEFKSIIETIIQPVLQSKVKDALSLPVPKPDECKGDIVFGTVFQDSRCLHEFKLTVRDFSRHIAILASAGHGKTTEIINICHQLLEHGINFLAFDFKQDFRHLNHLPILVLRWNWLRVNPFRPPEGVDEFQWIGLVCDLFAHTYGWYQASRNYLFEFVNQQYQKGRENCLVSLEKVKEAIDCSQDKEFERQRMKTVVLNRVSTLLTSLHEVLDCDEGFPVSELLNFPIVIEMDECPDAQANFLINFFLLYIFEYRKAQLHRGSLKHVIIFDEAHRIFYRQPQFKDEGELGDSVINQIPRLIRDYDEGLIFATQEPHNLNDSVMANTDVKMVGYLGNGIDIEAIQKAFQLSDDDTRIIKRLDIGQFMIQKSGVNEGDPFLLEDYDYPFKKTVTDDELKERMKDFVLKMLSEPKQSSEHMLEVPQISERAAKILEHAGRFPLRKISQRYKELNIHPKYGEQAVQQLVDSGLIVRKPVQLSTGRPSIYLEPTELGKSWLKQNKIDISAWTDYVGNVGLEHRIYQWLAARALEKLSYRVMKEYAMDNKRFDVYAEKENKKIGIEVCISPKMNFFEAAKTAEKLDELIFMCKDVQVLQLMQKELASLDIKTSRFRFEIAYRYLDELYSLFYKCENNENKSSNDSKNENNSSVA